MSISHVKSNTIADFTGTVTVFNSVGGTATRNATDLVRPSDWNSVHNQFYTITGNTNNASTASGTNVVLSGGNGVTLVGSNSVIGFSVATNYQSEGAYLTTARASNDAIGLNTALTANGVSVTANSSGLSLNFPAFLTTQSGQAFSADASSVFQTLVFQNSNGVSFSNNAGSLRVTHELQFTSATSAITSNALHSSASRVINIVAATNSTGGGTASLSGNVSFSNANGLTFYTSAGGAVVGSHNALTTARASNDGIGINTAQTNVTWTVNSSGLSLNAAGYAGTSTAITGNAAITLNSAGLSFNGASLAGTSTGFTGGASISGSFTHNSAGLAVSLSHPAWITTQTNQTLAVYAVGNTTGQSSSSTYDARTLSVDGGGIVSAGWSNSTLRISATQSNQAFSAGAASSAFQTLSFQDSNGVSFSNNAGAIRLTHDLQFTSATSAITANALHSSASRVFNVIAATNNTGGGTASLSSNVSFSNANSVSFYTSVGNAIVASIPNFATGEVGLATAQTNVTWTVNSAGISLNAAGYAGTGTSATNASVTLNSAGLAISVAPPGAGAALSAGTQSVSTGTVAFANSNGITFGMSGSSQITASHNGLTQQSTQPVAVSGGNGSFAFSTLSFSNANGISFGTSAGNALTASHNAITTARASNDAVGLNTAFTAGPLAWTVNSSGISLNAASAAGTTTGFAGANISASMTHNTAGLNLSFSVAAPGAAAEANAINLLGANTAGNTTASGSTIGWSGINVTLSGSNASQVYISAPAVSSLSATGQVSISTNGSTISIGVPNLSLSATGAVSIVTNGTVVSIGAPLNATVSSYCPWAPGSTVSQTNGAIGVTSGSMWAFPMPIDQDINFNCARMYFSASWASTTVAASQTITHQYGIYTRNGASLSRVSSGSYSMAGSFSSISGTLSYPTATGTAGYTYGTTTWAATANGQSLVGTVGQRQVDLQFGNTMSDDPGMLWFVFLQRQATAGAAAGLSTAMVANAMFPLNNVAPMGQSSGGRTTNASDGMRPFGVFTSTNSAGHSGTALIDALAFSGFANTISNIPLLMFANTN